MNTNDFTILVISKKIYMYRLKLALSYIGSFFLFHSFFISLLKVLLYFEISLRVANSITQQLRTSPLGLLVV